jgi:hypothetical protein
LAQNSICDKKTEARARGSQWNSKQKKCDLRTPPAAFHAGGAGKKNRRAPPVHLGKVFDMDFLQKYFNGIFELPLPRNTQARTKKAQCSEGSTQMG